MSKHLQHLCNKVNFFQNMDSLKIYKENSKNVCMSTLLLLKAPLRVFRFVICLHFGLCAASSFLAPSFHMSFVLFFFFLEIFNQNLSSIIKLFLKVHWKMASAFAAGHLLLGSSSCGIAWLECLNRDKAITFLLIYQEHML